MLKKLRLRQKKNGFLIKKRVWVDQGSEFYNNPFKKWLKDNNNKSLLLLKDLLEL